MGRPGTFGYFLLSLQNEVMTLMRQFRETLNLRLGMAASLARQPFVSLGKSRTLTANSQRETILLDPMFWELLKVRANVQNSAFIRIGNVASW